MYALGMGPGPHLARLADHRARPAGRRRDHRHRDDGGEDGAGLGPRAAATFAWTSTALPMLTGALVTAAGFLPIGFAKSSTGEYAGGIFWIVGIALIVSWLVAVLFTPYLGAEDAARPRQARRAREIPTRSTTRASIASCARDRLLPALAQDRGRRHGRCCSSRCDRGLRPRAAAVLPDLDAPRADRRAAPEGRRGVRRDRPSR